MNIKILTLITLLLSSTQAMAATSLTRGSITWYFNSVDYTVGYFVSGEPYVIAPSGLTISSITPAWDGTDNGAQINPVGSTEQGYSNQSDINHTYSSSLNVADDVPISLSVGDKLISTTSSVYATTGTTVDEAAILTVVSSPPASGSFRPGYAGTTMTMHNESEIDYDVLADLTATASVPTMSVVADKFARPWIDHLDGSDGKRIHPDNNMQDYGRDFSDDVSEGALMLNCDFTDLEKEDLLIGMIQLGIDNYSITQSSGTKLDLWRGNGGHSAARKLPILLAGKVLNHSGMLSIGDKSGDYLYSGSFGSAPADAISFGMDNQTFTVTQEIIDCTNDIGCTWDPINADPDDPGTQRYTSGMMDMPEWGATGVYNPAQNNASWLAPYRSATTLASWHGQVLSAHIMGLKTLWNHGVLFDYTDRHMAISNGDSDPFGYTVADEESGNRSNNDFTEEMWDTYRDDYTYPTYHSLGSIPLLGAN